MANSQYEYVKEFELSDRLLPGCWIVVRVDGHNFHSFSSNHGWIKPNDHRAVDLMNECARSVMTHYSDIVIAIGMSDEFSFVIHPSSTLYERRREKLSSTIVSAFTSQFLFQWKKYFPDVTLQYPPHFDGRCVLYPTDQSIKDYLSWRQVDCHINNLYNTTFWKLVQSGQSTQAAQNRLKDTDSAGKNEILFKEFGINYNDLPAIDRKGSILVWDRFQNEADIPSININESKELVPNDSSPVTLPDASQSLSAQSTSQVNKQSSPRVRRRVVIIHEDLINPQFYVNRPGIVPYMNMTEWKKAEKKIKRQQYRTQQPNNQSQNNIANQPYQSVSDRLGHLNLSSRRAAYDAQSSSLNQSSDIPIRRSNTSPPLAVDTDLLSHPGTSFLNSRRLSIATLSPEPQSPNPAESPINDELMNQSMHSRSKSINPSNLYHDIVQRAFQAPDSAPADDQMPSRAASVPVTPMGRRSSMPSQLSLTHSNSALPQTTSPMPVAHRKVHKSGFAAFVVDEETEADVTAESTPANASATPAQKETPSHTQTISSQPAKSSTMQPSKHRQQASLAFDVMPASRGSVATPGAGTAPSFFSNDSVAPSVATSPSITAYSLHQRSVDRSHQESANNSRQNSPRFRPPRTIDESEIPKDSSIFDECFPYNSPDQPDSYESSINQSMVEFSLNSPSYSLTSTSTPTYHLFDHFLVLGCMPEAAQLPSRPSTWLEQPRILLEFPAQNTPHADELASFAFPNGVFVQRVVVDAQNPYQSGMLYGQRQFQRGENVHCFMMKTASQSDEAASQLFSEDVRYGVCVVARESTNIRDQNGTRHELNCATAYCFISRYPFFWLYAEVLFSLLMLQHLKRASVIADAEANEATHVQSKPLGPHRVEACVSLLKRFYGMRPPQPGGGFLLDVSPSLPAIGFERFNVSDPQAELSLSCQQWALYPAWTFVSAEMIVDLMELGLRESKIIVVDPNLAMMSAAVLSLIPLFRPLTWSSVLLPTLPQPMHDFLDAPVPIIVGVSDLPERLCAQKHLDATTAIWFPSGNKLWLPPHFKSLLPQRSKLVNAVKKHLQALRKNKPSFYPGRTPATDLPYRSSPSDHQIYSALLKETYAYIELQADYMHNTQLGLLPVEKEREPFANALRQTQMMQMYLQKKSEH